MKKLTSIILALLLTAAVATSCGKTEDDVLVDVENPVVDETPVEDDAPVEDETPAEDENPADETPVEGEVEEAPVEGETEEDVVETPDEAPVEDEAPVTGESIDVSAATAEEIINAINEIDAPEFMHGVIPVDMTDADALKMFTGLDSADGIKEVAVCESMMGSQAYSLVVVKLDGADAKTTAEAMKSGIDQRKWICVEADDLKVSGKGDTVMLIMVDSEYKESISAASVTEAFKTVCGGSLDFEI